MYIYKRSKNVGEVFDLGKRDEEWRGKIGSHGGLSSLLHGPGPGCGVE